MHMKKMHKRDNPRLQRSLWQPISIALLCLVAMILALLVPLFFSKQSTLLTDDVKSRYIIGSLAESDVQASETFFYIDSEQTEAQHKAASASVLPRFRLSLVESTRILNTLEDTFSRLQEQHTAFASLNTEQQLTLRTLVFDVVQNYVRSGIFVGQHLEHIRQEGYEQLLLIDMGQKQQTLSTSALYTTQNVGEHAEKSLSEAARMLHIPLPKELVSVVKDSLEANAFFDAVLTAADRSIALQQLEPVMVKVEKGSYILKKDHVITATDVSSLAAMRLVSASFSLSQLLGRALFIVVITASVLYVFHSIFSHNQRKNQFIIVLLGAVVLTQLLLWYVLDQAMGKGFKSLDPFLPVFVVPLLITLLTNRSWAGMAAAVLLGSYAMLLPGSTETTFFFIIGVSFAGIYSIRFVSRRIDMVFQWIFGIASSILLVFLNSLYHGYSLSTTLFLIVVIAANMSITYVLVNLVLPLVEYVGNIPTQFRLRELAYSGSPLLTRLSSTAIGTYNHSIMVAEIAHEAAKAVGADPLLARVGGLYHDIGKMEHPEYFIENQSGENKHDELKASLSVAIIKSHVKIGVEKAREARLPQEVQDIISQHHGNDIIAVFLKEAQLAAEAAGSGSEVKKHDYAYDNPIPQTPEAAIVMLADASEAASRTIRKPSAQKYEKLINQILMGKIERKQLVASRLSLTDLDMITKVFVQTFMGKHHGRLDYPNQEKEDSDG